MDKITLKFDLEDDREVELEVTEAELHHLVNHGWVNVTPTVGRGLMKRQLEEWNRRGLFTR